MLIGAVRSHRSSACSSEQFVPIGAAHAPAPIGAAHAPAPIVLIRAAHAHLSSACSALDQGGAVYGLTMQWRGMS